MSQKNSMLKIKKICMNAMKHGVDISAKMNGISKGRVSKIFRENKQSVFMLHEIYDESGRERNFNELRRIFNSF